MNLLLGSKSVLGILPAMYDDVVLRYIALWTFVCGASLVWVVLHLRRNATFRKTVCDCDDLQVRLKNILHHSRDVLYSIDIDKNQFIYLSPSCFSISGYTPKEIQKMGWDRLLQHVHPDDKEEVLRLAGSLGWNGSEKEWQGVVEYRLLHKDGQYRSVSDHLHVVYGPSGSAKYVSGSLREVTQIARLEESLHILERRFHDSQKMAGLGLLASGIAHDFNNLMTVVLGNTELALIDQANSPTEMLEEIKRTTLRAAELANQMLVYSGKTTVQIDRINLSSVVKEMASLLDISISKKVNIEYCLAENPPLIEGDVSQVRQITMNLITNASEAIGDCEGVIAISIHEVNLRPGDLKGVLPEGQVLQGRYIQLEVSDTGDGMSPETLSRIFDPMFTTKITGRGLGLASLLNAVQRHRGAVTVESEEGAGTVFRVYFPAQLSDDIEESIEFDDLGEVWKGYGTVLISDDEEAILEVTRSLLERIGFRVITAADGVETVDRYMENAEDITLLLIDLNMPRLNGLESVQRIRHIKPNLPVLFMSGYPCEKEIQRLLDQPRIDFLKKPFLSRDLIEGIRKVMEPVKSE